MLTLELNHLRKQYKNKVAVADLSLRLEEGVYGLLGANGAGKTTLLRMLCDILKPTSGSVLCNGTEVREMGGEYRRLLGYLPQDFGYYPEMKAERYMRYLAELKALPPDLIRSKTEELLRLVELYEVRNKKIKTFSGGMLRRLGIAQAMLNDPEILILDEPTAGLDPKERIRFRNIISSFSRNRIVILSTHIVSDVEYIADQILLMKQGELISQGDLHQITEKVRGCVWECVTESSQAQELNERYAISNLRNCGEKVSLRIVAKEKPVEDAVPAEPNLEDVYLFYFTMKAPDGGCALGVPARPSVQTSDGQDGMSK